METKTYVDITALDPLFHSYPEVANFLRKVIRKELKEKLSPSSRIHNVRTFTTTGGNRKFDCNIQCSLTREYLTNYQIPDKDKYTVEAYFVSVEDDSADYRIASFCLRWPVAESDIICIDAEGNIL